MYFTILLQIWRLYERPGDREGKDLDKNCLERLWKTTYKQHWPIPTWCHRIEGGTPKIRIKRNYCSERNARKYQVFLLKFSVIFIYGCLVQLLILPTNSDIAPHSHSVCGIYKQKFPIMSSIYSHPRYSATNRGEHTDRTFQFICYNHPATACSITNKNKVIQIYIYIHIVFFFFFSKF